MTKIEDVTKAVVITEHNLYCDMCGNKVCALKNDEINYYVHLTLQGDKGYKFLDFGVCQNSKAEFDLCPDCARELRKKLQKNYLKDKEE